MWVKLDDNLPDHPKIDGLTDGAFRLYIASLCHAQKYLTDGLITADRPARLMPGFRRKLVHELVDAGLWEPDGTGWRIHDFIEWNKTRDYWEKKRRSEAQRISDWRQLRRERGGVA